MFKFDPIENEAPLQGRGKMLTPFSIYVNSVSFIHPWTPCASNRSRWYFHYYRTHFAREFSRRQKWPITRCSWRSSLISPIVTLKRKRKNSSTVVASFQKGDRLIKASAHVTTNTNFQFQFFRISRFSNLSFPSLRGGASRVEESKLQSPKSVYQWNHVTEFTGERTGKRVACCKGIVRKFLNKRETRRDERFRRWTVRVLDGFYSRQDQLLALVFPCIEKLPCTAGAGGAREERRHIGIRCLYPVLAKRVRPWYRCYVFSIVDKQIGGR